MSSRISENWWWKTPSEALAVTIQAMESAQPPRPVEELGTALDHAQQAYQYMLKLAPTMAEPNATAGWRSIVFAVIFGEIR